MKLRVVVGLLLELNVALVSDKLSVSNGLINDICRQNLKQSVSDFVIRLHVKLTVSVHLLFPFVETQGTKNLTGLEILFRTFEDVAVIRGNDLDTEFFSDIGHHREANCFRIDAVELKFSIKIIAENVEIPLRGCHCSFVQLAFIELALSDFFRSNVDCIDTLNLGFHLFDFSLDCGQLLGYCGLFCFNGGKIDFGLTAFFNLLVECFELILIRGSPLEFFHLSLTSGVFLSLQGIERLTAFFKLIELVGKFSGLRGKLLIKLGINVNTLCLANHFCSLPFEIFIVEILNGKHTLHAGAECDNVAVSLSAFAAVLLNNLVSNHGLIFLHIGVSGGNHTVNRFQAFCILGQ